MLLSEAFNWYCKDVIIFTNQSPKTEDQHFQALRCFVKYVSDVDTSDLTFEMVRKWAECLRRDGRSSNTARFYIIKLRNVLRFLELKNIKCLKVGDVPLPKRKENIPEFITPLEVEILIHKAPFNRGKAMISMLYASGIRVTELCNLNRNDLHDDRSFSVMGKGNKPRLCFYDERTSALLKQYLRKRRDNHPALFVTHKTLERLNKGHVEAVFRCARAKAGFDKRITPHTMRHSYATNLMQNGMHIYSVSRLLGHASIQTTSIYLHATDIRLQEEYSRFHTVK